MSNLNWFKLINQQPTTNNIDRSNVNVFISKTKLKDKKVEKSKSNIDLLYFKYKSYILWLLLVTLTILTSYFFSFKKFESTSKSKFQPPFYSSNSTDKSELQEPQYFNFLATTEQHFAELSLHEVPCSNGYRKEAEIGVQPQRCGTVITDTLINETDAIHLRKLAIKLIDKISDTNIHTRESLNLKWVNLHNVFRKGFANGLLNKKDFELIKRTASVAKKAVALAFALPEEYLFFHGVCQFTRYHPIVPFSEFKHVDKVRSKNLIVTSILWLSTVDVDFGGGRLEFLTGPGDKPFDPIYIEPKMGRFSAWTSSYENPHGVQEVEYGYRYALILAFTAFEELGHSNMDFFRDWALTAEL